MKITKSLSPKTILITLIIIVFFVGLVFFFLAKNKKQNIPDNQLEIQVNGMIFQQMEGGVASNIADVTFYQTDLNGQNEKLLFTEKGIGWIDLEGLKISSDGQNLAYRGQGEKEIKIYNFASQQTTTLPVYANTIESLIWSRDNKNIFVQVVGWWADSDPKTEIDSIYKTNIQNQESQLLAEFNDDIPLGGELFGVSVDEKTFYLRNSTSEPNFEDQIYYYNLATKQLNKLFNEQNGVEQQGILAPDFQQMILVSRQVGEPRFDSDVHLTGIFIDLYSLKNNQKIKNIATFNEGEFEYSDDVQAIFSPDQTKIAYQLYSVGRKKYDPLKIVDLSNGELIKSIDNALPESWSTDGQLILFTYLDTNSQKIQKAIFNLATNESYDLVIHEYWDFTAWIGK